MDIKKKGWPKPILPRLTPPCKDCQDRQIGCHGKCDRYEKYWRQQQRKREERQIYLQGDYWPKGRKK